MKGFFQDPRYRLLLVLGAVLALIDQAVKWAVVWYFENEDGARTNVIKGFFDLILTRNPGAAWSMLGDLEPDWLRVGVFITLSIAAIIFIFYYASKAKPEQRMFLWGLGFVFGGALGNLIDRVLAGEVVDYLEFYTRAGWVVSLFDCSKGWGCRFPAFNVADIAINIGVGLLLLDAIRQTLRGPEPEPVKPLETPPVDPTAPPAAAPVPPNDAEPA